MTNTNINSYDTDNFQEYISELRKAVRLVRENKELSILCETLDYLNDPKKSISDDADLSKIILEAHSEQAERDREAFQSLKSILDKDLHKAQFVDGLEKMLEFQFYRLKEHEQQQAKSTTSSKAETPKKDYSQLTEKEMLERLDQIRNKKP